MKIRIIAVVAFAVSVAGCVSEDPATGEAFQELGFTCQRYGFKPGSSEYSSCMLQLDQQRISESRRKRLAFSQAMSNMGNQIQADQRNQQMINAANRPVNCTSRGYGNTVQTSCY